MNSKLIYLFFLAVLFELALMGSGQMLKVGPLTFRMVFFLVAIALACLAIIYRKKTELYFTRLVMGFSLLLGIGIFMAAMNLSSISLVLGDLKPLIFFYTILFFAAMIRDENDIRTVRRVIEFSAVFLALAYLLLLACLLAGLLNFGYMYALLDSTTEVYFHGTSGFFYKGFLYMCIGVFFFMQRMTLKNILALLLVLVAMILTFTRGFLLSIVLVIGLYMLFYSKQKKIALVLFLLFALAGAFLFPYFLDAVGDKSDSDAVRFLQIKETFDAIDPVSFIIGHGLGNGVPSRPEHMEIAFLEIFHKQGILGIGFWFGLLALLMYSFYKADKNGNRREALPYLLSSIFVYLQSFTNPYLNNPIGMSVVLLSLVVVKRLETPKYLLNK